MTVERVGTSLLAVTAVAATLLAASAVWLFVTSPVTLADAMSTGTVTPPVRELASALGRLLSLLLGYL